MRIKKTTESLNDKVTGSIVDDVSTVEDKTSNAPSINAVDKMISKMTSSKNTLLNVLNSYAIVQGSGTEIKNNGVTFTFDETGILESVSGTAGEGGAKIGFNSVLNIPLLSKEEFGLYPIEGGKALQTNPYVLSIASMFNNAEDGFYVQVDFVKENIYNAYLLPSNLNVIKSVRIDGFKTDETSTTEELISQVIKTVNINPNDEIAGAILYFCVEEGKEIDRSFNNGGMTPTPICVKNYVLSIDDFALLMYRIPNYIANSQGASNINTATANAMYTISEKIDGFYKIVYSDSIDELPTNNSSYNKTYIIWNTEGDGITVNNTLIPNGTVCYISGTISKDKKKYNYARLLGVDEDNNLYTGTYDGSEWSVIKNGENSGDNILPNTIVSYELQDDEEIPAGYVEVEKTDVKTLEENVADLSQNLTELGTELHSVQLGEKSSSVDGGYIQIGNVVIFNINVITNASVNAFQDDMLKGFPMPINGIVCSFRAMLPSSGYEYDFYIDTAGNMFAANTLSNIGAYHVSGSYICK